MPARTRPVVGLTAYEEQARWGVWDTTASLVPTRYVRAIEGAGGIVVLLPPQHVSAEEADDIVSRLDALVLAGGNDVDPRHYGAEPHAKTVVASGERDEFELALVDSVTRAALPTLGICRGVQLINVARGGSLIQHLPEVVGHDGHLVERGLYGEHKVTVSEGSLLSSILAARAVSVTAHHHQAVDRVGEGLEATVRAEDGVVEALEDPSIPFLVGVQWHPEVTEDHSLFRALIAAARATP